jgi:hypothetical protein
LGTAAAPLFSVEVTLVGNRSGVVVRAVVVVSVVVGGRWGVRWVLLLGRRVVEVLIGVCVIEVDGVAFQLPVEEMVSAAGCEGIGDV